MCNRKKNLINVPTNFKYKIIFNGFVSAANYSVYSRKPVYFGNECKDLVLVGTLDPPVHPWLEAGQPLFGLLIVDSERRIQLDQGMDLRDLAYRHPDFNEGRDLIIDPRNVSYLTFDGLKLIVKNINSSADFFAVKGFLETFIDYV